MKILYHNDHDGQCSAFLIGKWSKYQGLPIIKEDFVECYHGMKFPFNKIKNHEKIYILDFTFKPDEMKQIYKKYKYVTWIDHHKTAIEDNKDLPFRGIRISGLAACELTWIWININNNNSGNFEDVTNYDEAIKYVNEDMPKFVRLIGDLDVFRLKMSPDSSEFYYGLSSENEHPYDGVWNKFYNYVDFTISPIDNLILIGKTILNYINKNQYRNIKNYGYSVKWRGKKCIVLNTPNKGSFMFKDFPGYDIMLVYCHRNDEKKGLIYEVSLYSENPKIDVSKIAHEFGGGGHKGAAGFRCNSLPWENCKNKKV